MSTKLNLKEIDEEIKKAKKELKNRLDNKDKEITK